MRIEIVGNWMIIKDAKQYLSQLKALCSFTYRQFNFQVAGKNRIHFKRQKCYLLEKDEQGNIIFICRKGLKKRICNFILENKIPHTITDDYDETLPCYIPDTSVLEKFKLRQFQRECIEAIIKNPCGLISSATGFGKTFILSILPLIFPKANFVIICRSREVVNEVLNRCQSLKIEAAKIDGQVQNVPNYRVLIFTAGSLHKCPFDKPDFILADECHELVTPRTLKYLYQFHKGRMYGFSATMNTRADGAHFHLESIFGEEIFKIDYQLAAKASLVVPIVVRWFNVPQGPTVQTINHLSIRKRIAIWRNSFRNKIIAEAALEHYKNGQQVLILVETVDHALRLKKYLPQFVVCAAGIDMEKFERLMKNYEYFDEVCETIKRRDEIKEQFQKRKVLGVIATNIWSAGVSFDDLEVLVRADARISKTVNLQAPGRVCRIPKTVMSKECGIVIDFIDQFDPIFYNHSKERFRIYRNTGWLQCDSDWKILRRI